LALSHDPLASVVTAPDPILCDTIDVGQTGDHLEDPAGPVMSDGIMKGFASVRACAVLDAHPIADFKPTLRHGSRKCGGAAPLSVPSRCQLREIPE